MCLWQLNMRITSDSPRVGGANALEGPPPIPSALCVSPAIRLVLLFAGEEIGKIPFTLHYWLTPALSHSFAF